MVEKASYTFIALECNGMKDRSGLKIFGRHWDHLGHPQSIAFVGFEMVYKTAANVFHLLTPTPKYIYNRKLNCIDESPEMVALKNRVAGHIRDIKEIRLPEMIDPMEVWRDIEKILNENPSKHVFIFTHWVLINHLILSMPYLEKALGEKLLIEASDMVYCTPQGASILRKNRYSSLPFKENPIKAAKK